MLSWLREELAPGPRSSIWVVIGVAATLAGITLMLPWGSIHQARIALSSIGLVLLLAAHLRPATLWFAGSTQLWRRLFGDRGTVWLSTLIGIVTIAFAWLHAVAQ
jgi:hypothetical protein